MTYRLNAKPEGQLTSYEINYITHMLPIYVITKYEHLQRQLTIRVSITALRLWSIFY